MQSNQTKRNIRNNRDIRKTNIKNKIKSVFYPLSSSCHTLTDQECYYYLIQYPDVCNGLTGFGQSRLECARQHWRNIGCKEGRNYKLPATCNYTLTDQEAICYIQQNNLDYKLVGNDLNKAREHWKTKGCISNLNYSCPIDSAISILQRNVKVSDSQLADLSVDYKNDHDASEKKIQDILKMEVTSLPFVFDNVKIQNQVLEKQLGKTNDDKLTNNQGTVYTETRLKNLMFFNTILFWIYYIFVFIFAIFLFFVKTGSDKGGSILPKVESATVFSEYTKFSLILLFTIFPFIAYSVEYILWLIGHYMYSLVNSKIFN